MIPVWRESRLRRARHSQQKLMNFFLPLSPEDEEWRPFFALKAESLEGRIEARRDDRRIRFFQVEWESKYQTRRKKMKRKRSPSIGFLNAANRFRRRRREECEKNLSRSLREPLYHVFASITSFLRNRRGPRRRRITETPMQTDLFFFDGCHVFDGLAMPKCH